MKLPALLDAYDRECRAGIRSNDPLYRVERDGTIVRMIGPDPHAFCNTVVHGRLDSRSAPGAIRDQVAYFDRIGHDFEWKHYDHDAPPELPALLEAAGFRKSDSETLFFLDVKAAPALSPKAPHEVRRIGADRLADILDLQKTIYDHDFSWLRDSLARELAHAPDRISIYAIYDGSVPVAAAWTRFEGSFGFLHGGSTRPSHRKRGLYRALLARRLEEARDRGLRWLTADATEMSRPILEKFGFIAAGRTTPYLHLRTRPAPVSPQ